jgi:hypothetical protein
LSRQEATGIPNLLVAPKKVEHDSRAIYEDGVGDYRGWYEDGAYCSAPQDNLGSSSETVEEGVTGIDPRVAYFDSILARYETLRTQLHQTPPPEVMDKLDKDHPIHVGRLNVEVARWWRWMMRAVDPAPAQLASMDKGTVFRLLGILTSGTALKRGAEIQVGVSRWAWGLLAKLPDRGELTSEEIGIIRELGKKAVLVGLGFNKEQQWEEGMNEVEAGFEDEYEGGEAVVNDDEIDLDPGGGDDSEFEITQSSKTAGEEQKIGPQLPADLLTTIETQDQSSDNQITVPEDGEAPSEDLAAAKVRILQALKTANTEDSTQEAEIHDEEAALAAQRTAARWNTKATVDMIITVAGEIYGQRDLLEFRQTWGAIE